jgi:molybdopterin synthase catalytic subunit
MKVSVLFFGVLREMIGGRSQTIEVRPDATVADVVAHYQQQVPQLGELLPSLAISVNREYAGPDWPLNPGDEVALLPPVSGGMGTEARARIVREPIDADAEMKHIQRPEDGAVVVFEGIVRNQTRGRSTLYLDYDAYEAMAIEKMQALAEQAIGNFAVREVAIVHRLGRLQIGDTSVLIVVASAHRAAAFEACRWAIDTLKRIVPIWKKEYFVDGAVWADGEPFPAEIPRGGGMQSKPASK